MQEIQTVWLDVMGISAYPVFDAQRGKGGRDGRLTYPDEVADAPRHSWTVTEDGALVGTAGHLHPGGLWTDMTLTRDGRSTRLFRSKAVYFEPAGAVSWDVAMTATPPDWRVGLRKGDVISVSGTYDTKRASWYESMAIMPAMFDPGGTGPDPFVDRRRRAGPGHARAPGGERRARRRGLGRAPGSAADARAHRRRRREGRDPGLPVRAGRPEQQRPPRPPGPGGPGPQAHVREPRRVAHDLPHGHRLPRAVQPVDGDRVPARERRRSTSTRASWASARAASRRRRTGRRGRRRAG